MSRSTEITMFPVDTSVIYYPPSVERSDTSIDPVTGLETFVRVARIYVPPSLRRKSLENILGLTDHKLQQVAEMCGASVIDHEWGLMPFEGQADKRFLSSEAAPVPPGHRLVSRVSYIESRKRPEKSYGIVDRATRRYGQEGIFTSRRLGDMASRQFMFGAPAGKNSSPSLYLVDIEPIYIGFR